MPLKSLPMDSFSFKLDAPEASELRKALVDLGIVPPAQIEIESPVVRYVTNACLPGQWFFVRDGKVYYHSDKGWDCAASNRITPSTLATDPKFRILYEGDGAVNKIKAPEPEPPIYTDEERDGMFAIVADALIQSFPAYSLRRHTQVALRIVEDIIALGDDEEGGEPDGSN
jgi:hypothetical protein